MLTIAAAIDQADRTWTSPVADQPAAAARVTSTTVARACPDSVRAITYYRRAYRAHRTPMGLPGPVPRVWYRDCPTVQRRAAEWRDRAGAAREALERWQRTIGVHVARLNRGLAGTPMAGLGLVLEREGRRYGVSPYFMAAAAGTESSFGAAACLPFNAWGLGNCGRAWTPPAFRSWDQAIAYYARFLHSRWPNATTPYSFSGYAACDACWGRKTSIHMGRFGVGTSTTWGPPPT